MAALILQHSAAITAENTNEAAEVARKEFMGTEVKRKSFFSLSA